MDKVTEVLTIAKEILETEQVAWCQGDMFIYNGGEKMENVVSACAVGAIALGITQVLGYDCYDQNVFGGNGFLEWADLDHAARERLINHMDADSIPEFNDRPGTTKEDVLLAFKRAINAGEIDEG